MKNLTLILLALISGYRCFAQNQHISPTRNPVVIELFTSQGCSSCPAADKNLSRIIEAADKNSQPVYGLSFHVDYWNYIGWKDPYSSPAYTERQRKYSVVMNTESVYTPQLIVNGKSEIVGSAKMETDRAVVEALTEKSEYQVVLKSIRQQEGKISVSYSVSKVPNGLVINAAIVEKNVSNEVLQGENSGRRLAHRNVVRAFTSNEAKKEGIIEIESPKGLSASSVVIFIQDRQWHILGADGKNI